MDNEAGLQVIDFSDPANPQSLGGYPLEGWARDITLAGRHAFVAMDWGFEEATGRTGLPGLQIFDLSNPSSPEPAGWVATSTSATKVTVVGNRAYLSAYNLLVYELTGLPAFTSRSLAQDRLTLTWNEAALGMKLQKTPTLASPYWQDVRGSENSTSFTLPATEASAFFRLTKP
ncbi:MAG: hypothetical protein M5U12_24585 [Verrucomicrobia bacterium]|nr:hypothetical protein [Verrucomicrobiota bacterium]